MSFSYVVVIFQVIDDWNPWSLRGRRLFEQTDCLLDGFTYILTASLSLGFWHLISGTG
jgi:hypothetical protein